MRACFSCLTLALVSTLTFACPFAPPGATVLPEGHPLVKDPSRRLQSYDMDFPGYIHQADASESGSLSHIWPPATEEPRTETFNNLVKQSADRGDAELCYWSFQTLPGPDMLSQQPSVSDYDAQLWIDHTQGETMEAENFADMAVKRMQNLVQPGGDVVWTGCAVGRTLRRKYCDSKTTWSSTLGARQEDCSSNAVYNQTLMTPTAIVMFKVQDSTADSLWRVMQNWRAVGHAPQMTSELIYRGWGQGGQIITKLSYCSEIPEKFKYQNLGDCDQMGEEKLLADEAFDTWKGMRNLMSSDYPDPATTAHPYPQPKCGKLDRATAERLEMAGYRILPCV